MEENLRACKVCQQLKQRILVGKFDTKNKRYHDESGKTWSGSVCPACHQERMKNNMKALRVKRQNEVV